MMHQRVAQTPRQRSGGRKGLLPSPQRRGLGFRLPVLVSGLRLWMKDQQGQVALAPSVARVQRKKEEAIDGRFQQTQTYYSTSS